MKRLYVVRHGKAENDGPSGDDFDRKLAERGKDDAKKLGARLKDRDVRVDMIFSSPAKRARKTARILAKKIGYEKDKIVCDPMIYEDSFKGALDLIRSADNSLERLMIVGHNPGLTRLVAFLTGKDVDSLPTCGAACIDFDLDSWKDAEEGGGSLSYLDHSRA